MIKAKFELNPKTKFIKLTVKGHAGSAEPGKDLICASASILTYTVAQIVSDLNKRKYLKTEPTIKLEDGDAVITCKPIDEAFDEAIHTFLVIQTGFSLLAYNNENFVQVKRFK